MNGDQYPKYQFFVYYARKTRIRKSRNPQNVTYRHNAVLFFHETQL